VGTEGRRRRLSRFRPTADRGQGRPRHQRRIGQRRQIDPPDALGKDGTQPGGDVDREACLAAPAGAGEGDQAGAAEEEIPYGGGFRDATDEAGARAR
jgi:hypothetical protein